MCLRQVLGLEPNWPRAQQSAGGQAPRLTASGSPSVSHGEAPLLPFPSSDNTPLAGTSNCALANNRAIHAGRL
jgi:hypothetical protein